MDENKPLIDPDLFDRARVIRVSEELLAALEDEAVCEESSLREQLPQARLARITKQVEYEVEMRNSLERRARRRDREHTR